MAGMIEKLPHLPSKETFSGWTFVLPRLSNILEELNRGPALPTYVGRKAAASPATGLLKVHEAEQRLRVEQALTHDRASLPQPFRRVAH